MALKLAFVMFMLMAVDAPIAQAISCGQVLGDLSPCMNYFGSKGKKVPPGCCDGIRSLNSAAKTTQDRQTACNCIKNAAAAAGIRRDNYRLAAALPGKCGVDFPYKISPKTDCKRVK